MAAMDLLGRYTAPSSVSTITISGIPNTYKNLIVELNTKQANTGFLYFRMNSNSDSIYNNLYINGTSWTGNNSMTGAVLMNDGVNVSQLDTITIFDYANTSFHKPWQSYHMSNYTEENIGTWRSTAAITSLFFYGGYNFDAGSQISIYGIGEN